MLGRDEDAEVGLLVWAFGGTFIKALSARTGGVDCFGGIATGFASAITWLAEAFDTFSSDISSFFILTAGLSEVFAFVWFAPISVGLLGFVSSAPVFVDLSLLESLRMMFLMKGILSSGVSFNLKTLISVW